MSDADTSAMVCPQCGGGITYASTGGSLVCFGTETIDGCGWNSLVGDIKAAEEDEIGDDTGDEYPCPNCQSDLGDTDLVWTISGRAFPRFDVEPYEYICAATSGCIDPDIWSMISWDEDTDLRVETLSCGVCGHVLATVQK